jgi:hypothetical protein
MVQTSPAFHTLTVLESFPFRSRLGYPQEASQQVGSFTLSQPAVAIQTKPSAEACLRLFVEKDEQRLACVFAALAKSMQDASSHRTRFLLEDDKAKSDAAIISRDGKLAFETMDPLVRQAGMTFFNGVLEPRIEAADAVIRAMAHYHWHLRRSNEKRPFQDRIRIKFLKLQANDLDDDLDPIVEPVDENEDLNNNGLVDLVVQDDAMYGIRIFNDLNVPLYAAVFFFDSDLSISEFLNAKAFSVSLTHVSS